MEPLPRIERSCLDYKTSASPFMLKRHLNLAHVVRFERTT